MTWFIDLRAESKGGGVNLDGPKVFRDGSRGDWSALAKATRGQPVLLAPHGFNVDQKDGERALSWWASWLTLPDRVVYVGVLWPGDSAWLHGLDYPFEGSEAMTSGLQLASCLCSKLGDAESFSFASHSLGARVVLQTIRWIKRLSPSTRVRHAMLMAGAIDNDSLSNEFQDAAQAVEKISVLSSSKDTVLEWAFPIGNLAEGILDGRWLDISVALGRDGPSSNLNGRVQGRWQIPDAWDFNHQDYLPSAAPERPPLPLPQDVPRRNAPLPPPEDRFSDWKPAWSAAVTADRDQLL